MPETSLLPRDGLGAWEAAQSEADAARWPLPADLVRSVDDPWTCPIDLLPWLAVGLGLEVWRDDWPEAFKRRTIAGIWQLKRNKTKLKGISAYAALEGASVVSAHRPRDKFWWAGGQSQADRDATIALMPYLRIAVTAGPAAASPAQAFWSGSHLRQFWRPRRFWTPSDAAARTAARARYVDGAVSTPVTVRGLDGALDGSLRVELGAPASPAKLFWGARRFWGAGAAFVPSDAAERVVAITPSAGAASFAVPVGLRPATVRPVRTAETVPTRPGMRFWGGDRAGLAWARAGLGGAWRASDAEAHVFDRVTLFDPARVGPGRQPYAFWGWSRFAAPAFTAEVRLDVPLARPAHQFGWGRPWGGGDAWQRSDRAPLWRALRAIKLAQAYRDTVWVDLRLTEPITFAPGLRFGDPAFKRFGDHRKLP